MQHYDITNPTKARRVIYDGIPSGENKKQKTITIDPGETKKDVALSERIVEELRARNKAVEDSDLIVRDVASPGHAPKNDGGKGK